jgi:hypothetical protein
MTRSKALAILAKATFAHGSLLEYEPGERLVVDHRLCDSERVVIRPDPLSAQAFVPYEPHVFEAAPYRSELDPNVKAWAYLVDPRS